MLFNNILVMSRKVEPSVKENLLLLIDSLNGTGCNIFLEAQTAESFGIEDIPTLPEDATSIDLVVVMGGDGSILQATPIALKARCPILGINHGRLGFLSDMNPTQIEQVNQMIAGEHIEEKRLVLAMTHNDKGTTREAFALNEVVLLPGKMTRMIEFSIEVNNCFVCNQHADGLIVTTPTGSTAHALSAGGPIIHPSSHVMAMVPLCPHRLSSRPIVIDASSEICITIGESNRFAPLVSTDGSDGFNAPQNSTITIQAAAEPLRLLHPIGHDHFKTLREKLGWEH